MINNIDKELVNSNNEKENLSEFKERVGGNKNKLTPPTFKEGSLTHPVFNEPFLSKCTSRQQMFESILNNINFSFKNNHDYVYAHYDVFNKYLNQLELYHGNLEFLERDLEKELSSFITSYNDYDRGYQSGLKIIKYALKYSKSEMLKRVNDELGQIL